jgi:hypothetical protein
MNSLYKVTSDGCEGFPACGRPKVMKKAFSPGNCSPWKRHLPFVIKRLACDKLRER